MAGKSQLIYYVPDRISLFFGDLCIMAYQNLNLLPMKSRTDLYFQHCPDMPVAHWGTYLLAVPSPVGASLVKTSDAFYNEERTGIILF